jgi:hypothetical protein
MALEEIENVDKELLATHYEAAVIKEFTELATWFKMPLDELHPTNPIISKLRVPQLLG